MSTRWHDTRGHDPSPNPPPPALSEITAVTLAALGACYLLARGLIWAVPQLLEVIL